MSQVDTLKAKLKGLIDEARPLQKAHADGTLTDDQRSRATVLASEIKSVGDELQRYTDSDTAFGQLSQLVDYLGKPANSVPGLLNGADPERKRANDVGSWRAFTQSEGYKRVAATGVGNTGHFALKARQRGNAILLKGDESPDQIKTLIYEGATANIINDERMPGIARGDSYERRVREAFLAGRTGSTSISFVRENVVTNNAAGMAEASTAGASPGTSAADFFESAITFTVDSTTVKSIGHMIPVTREMLDDVALFESYLTARAEEMLDDKVDTQLLTGAGTNDLTGLYNVSGISALDSTYFTSTNPLASAGQPGEGVDRLRRARTYHWVVNKARGSHVLINPYDLEDFELTRDANGMYLYPNGIGGRLSGMTVIETESATAGLPLVLDKRMFMVADKMENTAEITDSNREYFEFRILTLAVWTRLAFVPIRPAAAATVVLP